MNYNKKGLKHQLDEIIEGSVGRLVIAHKDRLLRFWAELIFAICDAKDEEVLIINKGVDTTFEEDWEILINQLEPRYIADALRPIWLEKPETASRLKQRIHAVLAWGWAHGYCTSNPVDGVGHLLP